MPPAASPTDTAKRRNGPDGSGPAGESRRVAAQPIASPATSAPATQARRRDESTATTGAIDGGPMRGAVGNRVVTSRDPGVDLERDVAQVTRAQRRVLHQQTLHQTGQGRVAQAIEPTTPAPP